MMLELILLGIIQGLTEWMPISSTGHLRLAEIMFGLRLPLLFDIALHMGTLIVTATFFRSEEKRIINALMRLDFRSEEGLTLKGIIVGSISTAVVGLAVIAFLKDLFYSEIKLIGLSFMLSGLIIYLSRMRIAERSHIDLKSAIVIGAMQGFSIIPGLSRSGLTISTALMLGIKREEAFSFSFLLSIPAILGGLIVTLYIEGNALFEAGFGCWEIFVGAIISMLLGFISLKALRRLLKHFHNFAFYPLLLGFILVLNMDFNFISYAHN